MRLRWIPRLGAWRLYARGRRRRLVAMVVRDRRGWLVCLPSGHAGPYGDLELARQSAERRMQ